MSEMVTRVARAIWPAVKGITLTEWENAHPLAKEVMLGKARAAIEAMREPTEKMIAEGDSAMDWDSSDATGQWYVHYHDGDAAKSWQAMIDEALK